MLLSIISYALHLLIIIPFFLLIPFPMFLRGYELEKNQKGFIKILKIYHVILMVAYVALIIALLTGLYLRFELSIWVVSVVLIWAAIAVFLGYTTKYVKNLLLHLQENQNTNDTLLNAKKYSKLLTLVIAVMFVLKYVTIYMM